MGSTKLVVPKQLSQVTLWVHPEGIVDGALFLSIEHDPSRPEDPLQVLNHSSPFIVVRRQDPDELRFYSKSSIVRVHYRAEEPESQALSRLGCTFHMMDGSLLRGEIRRDLPPDRSRFYDFLNLEKERFAKLYLEEDQVCLVNKSYIVCGLDESNQ